MKQFVFSGIIILLAMLMMVSCKKHYRCSCSYRNTVVYTKDLGNVVEKNALETCSSYDTTVPGEKWTCTLY